MQDFKPIEFTGELREKYWDGKSNTFVRYWGYLRNGFTLVNEAKNYFFAVLGSFWTAKVIVIFGYSIDPNWMLLAGVLGIPVIALVGRWQLYKANKAQEFMFTHIASVQGYKPFNMQVRTVQLLEEISKKLDAKQD